MAASYWQSAEKHMASVLLIIRYEEKEKMKMKDDDDDDAVTPFYCQVLADMAAFLMEEVAVGLFLWPLDPADEAAAPGKLPDPMYPGKP